MVVDEVGREDALPMLTSPEYACWVAHIRYFAALMKTEFTDASIAALDGMIHKMQEQFLKIKEYSSLWKPKNHYAQHIPADILLFGPPRGYWCMRFEAKNQDHKRAAKASNFKNVAQSVATFHSDRSSHRLFKRKRRKAVTRTDSGVSFCGMLLKPGTWILYRSVHTGVTKLAFIREVTDAALHVTSFIPSEVLQDDGHGGQIAPEGFMDSGTADVVTLGDGQYDMTLLLASVYKEGQTSFVEQP